MSRLSLDELFAMATARDISQCDEPLLDKRASEILQSVKKCISDDSQVQGNGAPGLSLGKEIFTIEEAADFLCVSLKDLEKEFPSLPVFSVGGRIRIRKSQLVKWIEEQERLMRSHRVLSLVNE